MFCKLKFYYWYIDCPSWVRWVLFPCVAPSMERESPSRAWKLCIPKATSRSTLLLICSRPLLCIYWQQMSCLNCGTLPIFSSDTYCARHGCCLFRTTLGMGSRPLLGCIVFPTCSSARACRMSILPRSGDSKRHGRTGWSTCAGGCPCGSGLGWVCGCSKCPRHRHNQGSDGIRTLWERVCPLRVCASGRICPRRDQRNQRPPCSGGICERRGFSAVAILIVVVEKERKGKQREDTSKWVWPPKPHSKRVCERNIWGSIKSWNACRDIPPRQPSLLHGRQHWWLVPSIKLEQGVDSSSFSWYFVER